LIDGVNPPTPANPEIDHTTSIIPASNLPFTTVAGQEKWVTDGAGLGDADDILMLTVRNEHEPFVGNVPPSTDVRTGTVIATSMYDNRNSRFNWGTNQTIESPLAEIVWYAVENPGFSDSTLTDQYNHFFGEPGMRTIYRRALLIAPWVNPYRYINPASGQFTDTFQIDGRGPVFTATPGLVRILPAKITDAQAVAALIAFQERYDLSVRVEFDPLLDPTSGGRWKIVANTLGDLTKRENRYEHHGFRIDLPGRVFPYVVASEGHGYSGTPSVFFVSDPDIGDPSVLAKANGNIPNSNAQAPLNTNGSISTFSIAATNLNNPSSRYVTRPFAYVNQNSDAIGTARAMLNDQGEVVDVVAGLVPLSGARRGEDVMLSDALAFDLRVYDPGAPLYPSIFDASNANYPGTILEPSDPGWGAPGQATLGVAPRDKGYSPANTANDPDPVGAGAYVDLGYWNATYWLLYRQGIPPAAITVPAVLTNPAAYGFPTANFWWVPAPKSQLRYINYNDPNYNVNFPQDFDYCTYDTWSFHYEHDGVNENGVLEKALGEPTTTPTTDTDPTHRQPIDRGTNGLDDNGEYLNNTTGKFSYATILGPDDVGERETSPPYDKPLRGVQVILRVYERDSRQIRQVSVDQHFVPE
jgi:hypothetical protein